MFLRAILLEAAAFAVFGEAPTASPRTRVFPLTYIQTPRDQQELVQIVRSMAEVSSASIGNTADSISVGGTADQIVLAAWLVGALDQSAPGRGIRRLASTPFPATAIPRSGSVTCPPRKRRGACRRS